MSINHFPYLPIVTYPDPSIQTMIQSPPKFNHLFIGHLPTFPANFMQICSEFFSQSCWQTDRQTNNDEDISSLAAVKKAQLQWTVMT